MLQHVACPACGVDVNLGDDERTNKRALCRVCDTPFDLTVEMLHGARAARTLILAPSSCPPTVRLEDVPDGQKVALVPAKRVGRLLMFAELLTAVGFVLVPGWFKLLLVAAFLAMLVGYGLANEQIELRGHRLRLRRAGRRSELDLEDIDHITIVEEPDRAALRIERRSGAPLILLGGRDRSTLEFVRDWLERQLAARS